MRWSRRSRRGRVESQGQRGGSPAGGRREGDADRGAGRPGCACFGWGRRWSGCPGAGRRWRPAGGEGDLIGGLLSGCGGDEEVDKDKKVFLGQQCCGHGREWCKK
ncbi:unnamed protein product [Ostreobium quekettii]|uniref:Uncharacterized protein n=1 Tax=Ostreobium quekettii TaxID=121088 RepID=A0A8S1J378_9CHLO|nr:unnamed protein product [Ostreobium quekettii]